jgi:hypothetical protein
MYAGDWEGEKEDLEIFLNLVPTMFKHHFLESIHPTE